MLQWFSGSSQGDPPSPPAKPGPLVTLDQAPRPRAVTVRVPLLQTRLSWALHRNRALVCGLCVRLPSVSETFPDSPCRSGVGPSFSGASYLLVSVVSSCVDALGWLGFTWRGERRLCEQCRPVRGWGCCPRDPVIRSASVVGGTAVSCGLRSWTCPRSGCSGDWGSPPAGTGEFTCSCLPSSLLLGALTCVGISIAVVPLVPTSVSHGANARFRISGCFPF